MRQDTTGLAARNLKLGMRGFRWMLRSVCLGLNLLEGVSNERQN